MTLSYKYLGCRSTWRLTTNHPDVIHVSNKYPFVLKNQQHGVSQPKIGPEAKTVRSLGSNSTLVTRYASSFWHPRMTFEDELTPYPSFPLSHSPKRYWLLLLSTTQPLLFTLSTTSHSLHTYSISSRLLSSLPTPHRSCRLQIHQ